MLELGKRPAGEEENTSVDKQGVELDGWPWEVRLWLPLCSISGSAKRLAIISRAHWNVILGAFHPVGMVKLPWVVLDLDLMNSVEPDMVTSCMQYIRQTPMIGGSRLVHKEVALLSLVWYYSIDPIAYKRFEPQPLTYALACIARPT